MTIDGYICQSPNYPEDYTAGTCECDFKVASGYKIEVFIEDVNLDSSKGDNILIAGGDYFSYLKYMILIIILGPDDKKLKCSWFLNTTKKYFFENNQVSLTFEAKNNVVNYSGFSVHFRRYGGMFLFFQNNT